MKQRGSPHPMCVSLLAALLCAVLTLTLCTGCDKGKETTGLDGGIDSTGENGGRKGPGPEDRSFGDIVNTPELVDTFNMVVVVDTSSTIHQSDPHRLALNAPVMLFESMFGGDAEKKRLDGAKHGNLNIITYNDTVHSCFSQLYSLDTESTVEELNKALRRTEIPYSGAYDSALGEALEDAVEMLPIPTPPIDKRGESVPVIESRQKNLVILFTDGYSTRDGNSRDSEHTQEADMPFFGGITQAPLERALRSAKQRQCEIIVLGLNTAGGLDPYWEEFKKIANYTQLDYTEPMARQPDAPLPDSSQDVAAETDLPDVPPVRSAEVGGGMFRATDAPTPYVDYCRVKKAVEAQAVFIQIASALIQGTGADMPHAALGEDHNTYSYQVNQDGITAVVFYVLSGDKDGVVLDDLFTPDGISLRENLRDWSGGTDSTRTTFWDGEKKIRQSWYSGCAILTILDPDPGTWTLYAHTKSGDMSQISVRTMQIGGIELELSFKQDDRYADDGTVFVRAKSRGEYMPNEFYDHVTGSIRIYPARSADVHLSGEKADLWVVPIPNPSPDDAPLRVDFSMAPDNGKDAMTYTHRAPFPGTYVVDVALQVSDVSYKASGRVFFEARPYLEQGQEDGIYVRQGKKAINVTLKLTDSWTDSVPLELEEYSWSPRGKISVKPDANDSRILTVTGLEEGDATLTVVAVASPESLPFQRRVTITYPVTVGR